VGVVTVTPLGGGGVHLSAAAANANCAPTDATHFHCKWNMLPGTKDSNLKNFTVSQGWTLTNKEAVAPRRYFYGSNYYGSGLDCTEVP
jgi:hypothetical protein